MCCEEVQKLGMYVILYEEERWSSGFAGGVVLKCG
jgi:hypothetical protein